ncbi:hypothetical protein P7K49_000164, partial [Saguinus oedipus]
IAAPSENAENERMPHFQTKFGRSRSRRFPVEELHGSPEQLCGRSSSFAGTLAQQLLVQ